MYYNIIGLLNKIILSSFKIKLYSNKSFGLYTYRNILIFNILAFYILN